MPGIAPRVPLASREVVPITGLQAFRAAKAVGKALSEVGHSLPIQGGVLLKGFDKPRRWYVEKPRWKAPSK